MGNRRIFSTRVDEDRIKDLKHLAVDTGRSLGNLLEEAIQDLIHKYGSSADYFQANPAKGKNRKNKK